MADEKQTAPRVNKLIELEVSGRIKPEHQRELDIYRAQGKAPKKVAGAGTEGERKASAFLSRALGSNRDYESAGVGPRNILTQNLSDSFPNATNTFINTEARQVADSAQDEFIAASLRQDSGAAIPEEELERQRRIYFPMPGDGPEAIKQKRQARLRALDGLVQSAGSGLTATQKEYLSEIQDDLRAAVLGEAPNGIVEGETPGSGPPDGQEVLGVGEAAERAIDRAAGVTDKDVSLERAGYYVDPQTGLLTVRISARDDQPASADRGQGGTIESADAFVRGAADTATLGFADELAAAGDTIFRGGTMRDNLLRQRAVDSYDQENHPILRGVGQLAGAAVPIGAGRIGLSARSPRDLAIAGGTVGSLYGVGSGETLGERFTGAGTGAVAGAAGGLALGKLSDLYMARRAARVPTARSSDASALLQASNDLGVDVLPADAGGPTTRLLTSAAASTPGGVFPITQAARRAQMQGGSALETIAGREGATLEKEAAGGVARSGALAYRSSSRDRIGRQYDRAARAADDARVEPAGALATLDRNIAELSDVPGGSDGLATLTALRDDIANRGTVSIDGIRGMRTQLRQKFMKEGLVGSDLERRIGQVLDAASDDVLASLNAAGKSEAASLYKAADRAWKERAETLDRVVMPIIGKKGEKSGEQIVDGLNAAAKGNNARLAKFFDSLPEDEAGAVRATLISQMGKARPGAQNAAGDQFSFDTFLMNWNSIGQSAKNTLFRGENRKAIDQLALIAEKAKAAGRYRNYSNTGLTILSGATASTALDSFATLGTVLAGQAGAGMLLSSPRVAKALLRIAQAKTPEVSRARVEGMSQIAVRDPTIRNEVIQLQRQLAEAFGVSPSTRAAADGEQPVRGEPVR